MGFYIQPESWTLRCEVIGGETKPYQASIFYRGAYNTFDNKTSTDVTDKKQKFFATEAEARAWINEQFETKEQPNA